jgi:hypothetical protein
MEPARIAHAPAPRQRQGDVASQRGLVIARGVNAACGALIDVDGDDVRARAANRRHGDQRRADTKRPLRATPHFACPFQVTAAAWESLGVKGEGLSMCAVGERRNDKAICACRLQGGVKDSPQKTGDRGQHALVDFLLARTERLQRRLRDYEGMIASLQDVQR